MKVAALLTGRGNNTLKDKNILPVLGKPLLYFPAMAAKNCPEIDSFYCSSDDRRILAAASECGYQPIVRPPELGLPTSQHIDVIYHALEVMKNHSALPDVIVVLLANNAILKSDWIQACLRMLRETPDATSAVPVIREMDHHPYRAKGLNIDGSLKSFFDFGSTTVSSNRQDLPPAFFLCHNFWVIRTDCLLNPSGGEPPWTFLGSKVLPFEVEESFDVHLEEDLKKTEAWLKANLGL